MSETITRKQETKNKIRKNYPEAYNMDYSKMTARECYLHRIEDSRRKLAALVAKIESPCGDKLSEIIICALQQVEELQNDEDNTEYLEEN